jgi:hypothetical protein
MEGKWYDAYKWGENIDRLVEKNLMLRADNIILEGNRRKWLSD